MTNIEGFVFTPPVRRRRDPVPHPIPPITDPLGRHWRQPPRERIEVDAESAMMGRRDFDMLAEYSTSLPTGTYEGKMWKAAEWEWAQEGGRTFPRVTGRWFLRWFVPSSIPGRIGIEQRLLLVVD